MYLEELSLHKFKFAQKANKSKNTISIKNKNDKMQNHECI